MAGWVSLLPKVVTVLDLALPAFTSSKDQKRSLDVHSGQIEELQSVAVQNAASIKDLAEQMRTTVQAVDRGAADLEQRLAHLERQRRLSGWLAGIAIVLAIIAIGMAGAALRA